MSTIGKLHDDSGPGGYVPYSSMFAPIPPTQEDVARVGENIVGPLKAKGAKQGVSCYADGTLTFEYRSGSSFVDLSKSYFAFVIQCIENGTGLDRVASGVELIPNVAHSMFRSVNVTFNGDSVDGGSNSNYQSQAFLAALLGMSFGTAQANSQTLALPDGPIGVGEAASQVNPNVAMSSENGTTIRRIYTQGNTVSGVPNTSTHVMQPAIGIWATQRLIPSNTNIRVVLTIASDPAVFWATAVGTTPAVVPKLCILDARFVVHQVDLTQDAQIAFDMQIQRGPALYPGQSVRCEASATFSSATFTGVRMLAGPTPSAVLAVIVPAASLSGEYSSLPYSYHTIGSTITSAQVNWGGQSFPNLPYGSIGGHAVNDPRLYQAYLDMCKKHAGSEGAVLTAMQFHRSFPVMAFPISPSGLTDGYDPLSQGSLEVNIMLDSAPAVPCQVVVLGLIPSVLSIDAVRRAVPT